MQVTLLKIITKNTCIKKTIGVFVHIILIGISIGIGIFILFGVIKSFFKDFFVTIQHQIKKLLKIVAIVGLAILGIMVPPLGIIMIIIISIYYFKGNFQN